MSSDGALSTSPSCSRNGQSLTMTQLALWAVNNGDPLAITYGKDPNNEKTWDGGRVYGCLCDPGFTGYDCSLRQCPMGDDPGTYLDHVEVQLVQCIANGGFFQLTFRNATTPPIYPNTTAFELKQILENLPTLTKLSVFFSKDGPLPPDVTAIVRPLHEKAEGVPPWGEFNTSTNVFEKVPRPSAMPTSQPSILCHGDGTQIAIINFDTIHGPLPALKVLSFSSTNDAGITTSQNGLPGSGVIKVFNGGKSVSGFTSYTGTTENVPCNNRGKCLTSSGICQCYPPWSSSNGEGGIGTRGDCGFRNDNL